MEGRQLARPGPIPTVPYGQPKETKAKQGESPAWIPIPLFFFLPVVIPGHAASERPSAKSDHVFAESGGSLREPLRLQRIEIFLYSKRDVGAVLTGWL
jgi:hypothetical protein